MIMKGRHSSQKQEMSKGIEKTKRMTHLRKQMIVMVEAQTDEAQKCYKLNRSL
jgi:hypothetical protein